MRLLALLVLASTLLAQDRDNPGAGVAIEQRLGETLPLDTPFLDETGRAVTLGEYFGKRPVVLALVYYECPMLCTLVLNGLVGSLKTIKFDAGDEYEVVAISIDPGETPALAAEKKKSYVARYDRPGTAAGWHFLTGKPAAIKAVADAVGFKYRYDKERDEYVHAAGITVLTPTGRLSRYFYGIEFGPRDLRLGLVEASGNKIGTFADAVLLLCLHYDPTVGKYGFAIQNALRLGGVLTVGVLLVFVVRALRRERRA